jgi:hypothetical protein
MKTITDTTATYLTVLKASEKDMININASAREFSLFDRGGRRHLRHGGHTAFIRKIPPDLPLLKGGITVTPLWQRGVRGDFMEFVPVPEGLWF